MFGTLPVIHDVYANAPISEILTQDICLSYYSVFTRFPSTNDDFC